MDILPLVWVAKNINVVKTKKTKQKKSFVNDTHRNRIFPLKCK